MSVLENKKIWLQVVGFQCITCRPIIEKQLRDVTGIKKVNFDYMTDRIEIEFDPSILTYEQIKIRLDNSGYKFVRMARDY